MGFFRKVALAAAAACIGQSLARPHPIHVHPGGIKDVVITKENTINGTSNIPKTQPHPEATQQLDLAFVNNLPGGAVNAYVTGNDNNNNVVFLKPDGTFYYPDAGGSTSPVPLSPDDITIPLGDLGSTKSITLPDFLSSGRIYFSAGDLNFYVIAAADGTTSVVAPSAPNPNDPSANINWGFVEFTNNSSGIYANISYVDFVGLILGMTLDTANDGSQSALGLTANAVSDVCSKLSAQSAKDGQPWNDLCQVDSNGNPIRALSPGDYISDNSTAFSDYWTDYVNQVYTHYQSNTLTVDAPQVGNISCTSDGTNINCDGDDTPYAKPSANDIFGCNTGPFTNDPSAHNAVHQAVMPVLCAAFDRSTYLLPGGDVQPGLPSTDYYTVDPTNYYSKFIHQDEVDGKGYAFPYDDVNPDGENQSGTVSDPDPKLLTIIVGGPLSNSTSSAQKFRA